MSSQSNMNETFWFENPSVLVTNICRFNPLSNGTFSYNMNAYTRLILIVMIVLFAITKELNYIYIGLILIIIIIVMYYSLRKDKFTDFGRQGSNFGGLNGIQSLPTSLPFARISPNETPQKQSNELLNQAMLPRRESDFNNTQVPINNPAKNIQIPELGNEPEYSKSTRSDSEMSKYVNGKIFQTEDQFIFDRNTVQFNTVANTSIPNDQSGFANWLYGTENNCKSGSIYMHRTGTPAESQSCNGFNVSTPTNFGNLNDYEAPSN